MPYPAKISREAILKCGLRLVERKGIEALSLRALARKLRVAANALYNYFPNRTALESAMAVEGYRILCSELEKISSGAPANGALLAFCKAYMRFARSHRRLFELMSRKRISKSESAAIHASMTSLIVQMQGRKLDKPQAAKGAFAVLAAIQGIVALEQQMNHSIPASWADFAVIRVVADIVGAQGNRRIYRR
jgi:AcrR family transcriptional regulator